MVSSIFSALLSALMIELNAVTSLPLRVILSKKAARFLMSFGCNRTFNIYLIRLLSYKHYSKHYEISTTCYSCTKGIIEELRQVVLAGAAAEVVKSSANAKV